MKLSVTTGALAILFIANAFSAFADEKLSSLHTALSDTTISGFVSAEMFVPAVGHSFMAFQPRPENLGGSTRLAQFSQHGLQMDMEGMAHINK